MIRVWVYMSCDTSVDSASLLYAVVSMARGCM